MVEFENIKYKINIKDIKSSYIINRLFSFLNEKQELEMIIYSKELQKICLIGIEDYKNFSRRYKIGEKNGKGKEYIIKTNTLIFEGEYLNGRKNGKGKEYNYDGKLKFEGEYLNGIKNGKGKEYYHDGKLKFEGEYLNNKIWNGIGYTIFNLNIFGGKVFVHYIILLRKNDFFSKSSFRINYYFIFNVGVRDEFLKNKWRKKW